MSTLQVVGTVAGAVIGAILTWPTGGMGALPGAAIGGALGAGINSIVNPPRIEGARIGDLNVVSSATGAVRPIGYGKIRVAGNVIWAIPIIEHKKTSKGGGKGGPVTTNYTYGATFALALCEGPVDSVHRIWADSKLVYDATSGSDTIKREGFNFRFHSGDGTQTADSIIEAHEGVGNVPGYRGTCYLVFDDIPLDDYGNRIPNITAEIVFGSEVAFDFMRLIRASPSLFGATLWRETIGVNPLARLGYVFSRFAFDDPGIIEFDLDTMTTTREKLLADVFAPLGDSYDPINDSTGAPVVGPDEALYLVATNLTRGNFYVVRVDGDTLLATNQALYTVGLGAMLCFISYIDPAVGIVSALVGRSFVFNHSVAFSVPDLALVWESSAIDGVAPRGLCQGRVAVGQGEAWIMSYDPGPPVTWYITKLTYTPAGIVFPELVATYMAADIYPTGVDIYPGGSGGPIYDESDNSIISHFTLIDAGAVKFGVTVKWSEAAGFIFSELTPTELNEWNPATSRVSGGTYSVLSSVNPTVATIDTATGAVISNVTWPVSIAANGQQLFDSGTQIIIAPITQSGIDPDGQWAKLRIGRSTSAGSTLGAIVLDQCERAGFDAGDIDVSDLTDVVDGFVISQRALVADVLKPLLQVYLVDAVESDYLLKFAHRGGATVADITEDELLRVSDNAEPYTETRQQEIELPMRVTLTYIDSDKDFQTNTQMAKRSRQPNPTVFTDNATDLQVAIVTTATPAKRMAEKILASVWNERKSFACRLPPKRGYLDAGDAVTLTLNDGYVIRGRLIKADVGVDHSIDAVLALETDGQYVSVAVADDGVPWAGSSAIANPLPSKLILLDTPLLRDIDDLGGRSIRGYWAGGSYRTGGAWPGAVLQSSPDVATWTAIDVSANEMTWGAIEVPPADPASFWRTQFDGTMTVRVSGGTYVPTSTDDLGLANTQNPMAIIKANGEVEIVQYRDVTVLGDDRYTLAVFYRGVRGTDAMGGGIAAGDKFVFLSTTGVSEISVPIGDHNVNEFYRLATAGSLGAANLPQGFTFHGRDLMPYAPSVRSAALSGSDIVITWLRRTRMGGELRDGIDTVPLNEATEAYEIDILDAPGGTVLRTLTSTSPTVTYLAANIAMDFGSTPDELSVDVYQMSDVVGRGFATETLLEVA